MGVRYLVIDGKPQAGFSGKPESPDEIPVGCELWDAQVIGEFDNLEEAAAMARKVNSVHLLTNTYEEAWSVIVVDIQGLSESWATIARRDLCSNCAERALKGGVA